ncbi:alanine/glycine:cation symporter family protein [Mycoplasma sp. P36-A1]|uniref:alanine/glycine:cation symporter family protein n=1 Tax=Mycoplasma sp. P36-A1 TaxID=3252900 RepID=UPI003C305CB4
MKIFEIFISETVAAIDAFNSGLASGSLNGFIEGLAALIWSPVTALLCLFAGLYFSFRMRFVQLRKIPTMAKLLFSGSGSDEGISSFQAFALAVAGRVGTGNIVGVATAIAYGGPGALFWMWAVAFFGAGSAYIESTLAQLYKTEIDGEYRGGPAYYFRKRGLKPLGYIFMFCCLIATGILLPGVQSNAIVTAVYNGFGISQTVMMIIVLVLIGIIIVGGTKSLSRAAEIIVPFMSGIYIIVAIIILIVNIGQVPATFSLIFRSAFGADAILGASLGQAILWGVKRGVFSNEAGQGTAPHAAAAAEVSHPAKQGLVQAFSVYFDTIFVCSATGLSIIITGAYSIFIPGTQQNGIFQTYAEHSTMGGSPDKIAEYTPTAMSSLIGGFGHGFIAIALFFFAFTTLMAYYYYAESNLELLMRNKFSDKQRKIAIWMLKGIFLAATYFFGIRSNAAAWAAADIGVGLMAIINIIGILIICKPAIICLKDFEKKQAEGKEDQPFVLEDLSIEEQKSFKGVDFWTRENISKKKF